MSVDRPPEAGTPSRNPGRRPTAYSNRRDAAHDDLEVSPSPGSDLHRGVDDWSRLVHVGPIDSDEPVPRPTQHTSIGPLSVLITRTVVERLRVIAKTYDASVAQVAWRGCWQDQA
ncbi:MAG TPA: hypothetical protein VNA67_02010 [Pseudonocardiaceae bacterium]|nr:hypothetical protein [Pseudonocardiaceae bacterium]